jgi:hypothetical protein
VGLCVKQEVCRNSIRLASLKLVTECITAKMISLGFNIYRSFDVGLKLRHSLQMSERDVAKSGLNRKRNEVTLHGAACTASPSFLQPAQNISKSPLTTL